MKVRLEGCCQYSAAYDGQVHVEKVAAGDCPHATVPEVLTCWHLDHGICYEHKGTYDSRKKSEESAN